jgi:hypothetical protein
METLLRHNFTSHYLLPANAAANLSIGTNAAYFELDDVNGETQLFTVVSNAPAVYHNNGIYDVVIINHDKFISTLPPVYQQKKKRCDLIVYTSLNQYFLLNELSDTASNYLDYPDQAGTRTGKKIQATKQLSESLDRLMNVPAIKTFINNFVIKRCCFFNKQPDAPLVNALQSFNRFNTLIKGGAKRANADIEAHGFELFDYLGRQSFDLN